MLDWPFGFCDRPKKLKFDRVHQVLTSCQITTNSNHRFNLGTELDLHRLTSGFHRAFATGVARQQGTLTLPDTWFRPPVLGLVYASIVETKFSKLAVSFLDLLLRIPLGTFRFCFQRKSRKCLSKSEARTAILVFRLAQKGQT